MQTRSASIPHELYTAIDRLANAVNRIGYTSAQVCVASDMGSVVPGHMTLFDRDGNSHFYMYENGNYYEYIDVPQEVR